MSSTGRVKSAPSLEAARLDVAADASSGGLAVRPHALSRTSSPGRWAELTRLVPDEVVHTAGVVARGDELHRALDRRGTAGRRTGDTARCRTVVSAVPRAVRCGRGVPDRLSAAVPGLPVRLSARRRG
ncbi:hypothetical protein [Streptomyces sp. NPDC048277]|uniref:hypothetical protein n=1 Tax=Streptomyces sp. NPDC048277 TaxID=3155027 RepID=UPI0033D6977D